MSRAEHSGSVLRVHLDLHECGTVIIDEAGCDLPDREAARHLAIRSARDIMCAELAEGRLCLSCRIDIRDADGRILEQVPFRSAVVITGL